MDLLESLDKAFETLFEDVESRMHHLLQILLGKKSRWLEKEKPDAEAKAKDYIRQIAQFDPTTGKNYMMFIIGQVAKGLIRLPEDGVLLKESLEKFMSFSRKANWKHPKDVMQYAHWRDLQKLVGEYEAQTAQQQAQSTEGILVTKAKEGAVKVIDIDVKTTSGPHNYSVVKVSTPAAVAFFGKGTQWCTSWQHDNNIYKTVKAEQLPDVIAALTRPTRDASPDNPWANVTADRAKQIISDLNNGDLTKRELKVPNVDRLNSAISNSKHYLGQGPMYIIYRDNQPYIQMTNSARDLKNVEDYNLKTTSVTLATIFREMMGQHQPPEVEASITRNMPSNTGQVSQDMVKVLTNHIKVGEANKKRALEMQQKKQQPPQTP